MATSGSSFFFQLLLLFVFFRSSSPAPTPTPWPPQFHATLFESIGGELSTIELWYDWPNGVNVNVIRSQLSPDEEVLYDVEWNNGTSFLYTVGRGGTCRTVDVGFGILRPNWLEGANYLGTEEFDAFLCHVFDKEDFIRYYEDVVSGRPVYWIFYTGRAIHVMNYELGAAMEPANWQAPEYCFGNNNNGDRIKRSTALGDVAKFSLAEFASLNNRTSLISA